MPKVVPEYKERAKERIVEAASVVFRRQGLIAGTMDEIAREIGVSKGALYLYFPTKTQLLEAVQRKFRTQFLEHVEGQTSQGDVAEGLVLSIDGILSGEFDPNIWHKLAMEAATDPEVREVMRRDAREDRRVLRQFLRKLEKDGRIPTMSDPDATVDAVMLLFQGTFTAATLRADPKEARAQLLRALRLVLGLRNAGSSRT